jgi:hypothetical protein
MSAVLDHVISPVSSSLIFTSLIPNNSGPSPFQEITIPRRVADPESRKGAALFSYDPSVLNALLR